MQCNLTYWNNPLYVMLLSTAAPPAPGPTGGTNAPDPGNCLLCVGLSTSFFELLWLDMCTGIGINGITLVRWDYHGWVKECRMERKWDDSGN